MNNLFHRISVKVSNAAGTPSAFLLALLVVFVWAITGPMFNFSPTWQLVINTGTTIVTFLMVFLVQNTQNRDSKAMHLKIDELIRTQTGARNSFVELENLSDEELKALDEDFQRLHSKHSTKLTKLLAEQLAAEQNRRSGHLVGGVKHVIDEVKNLSNHN